MALTTLSPEPPKTVELPLPPKSVHNPSWLRSALPTTAVICALAGLAYWGYRTDWTLPKFSALMGTKTTEEEWCEEHSVPEAQCMECNVNLVPYGKDYGWCKEHGVYQCTLHHPDVAQLKEPPQMTPSDFERAARALAVMPRVENNSSCRLHQKRIQFASVEALEKTGVDIAVVDERPLVEAIVANGEVVYDQTREAHLSSRAAGTVWRVEKQVGEHVSVGDVLALVDAAEIGRVKGEFLQAISQLRLKQSVFDRLKPLSNGAVAERLIRDAEAEVQGAEIRLMSAQQTLVNLGMPVRAEDFADVSTEQISRRIQFLGLPEKLIASLDPHTTTSNLCPVRAPLAGIVTESHVVAGEVVDVNRILFALADTSRMWLSIDARQDDAKYITRGQKVLFRPSDTQSRSELNGTISWISTAANDRTRTVTVRVELPNRDGKLRANTFGTARIVLREEPKAIMVPTEAVHWDGTCHVVFVRDKDFLQPGSLKFFHVRSVRVGAKDGNETEIIAGLVPGEVIASKNSVVLQSQLLKSALGAGCGCAHET